VAETLVRNSVFDPRGAIEKRSYQIHWSRGVSERGRSPPPVGMAAAEPHKAGLISERHLEEDGEKTKKTVFGVANLRHGRGGCGIY